MTEVSVETCFTDSKVLPLSLNSVLTFINNTQLMKLSSVSKLQSHSQSNCSAYRKSETIMPSTPHHSYDLNFKLNIVAEAEARNNNCVIACKYGIL